MSVGTVKWFDQVKRYGFITPEDGGRDVFVHYTAVANSGLDAIGEGQKLSFEVKSGNTGKSEAADLKLL